MYRALPPAVIPGVARSKLRLRLKNITGRASSPLVAGLSPGRKAEEGLEKFPETACLRARLIHPALKQQAGMSRDREGAVPFAEFCKTSEACRFSLSRE
jgi:hypothetical protein